MTILTSEANCTGQQDKCYIIVEVVWIVLSVPSGGRCSDS